MPPSRRCVPAIAAALLLVVAAPASAHRAGRVAVQVDSRIVAVVPATAGTATLDLGQGKIRLQVGRLPVVILGLAGEPMLQFRSGVVEVSLASPSARVFKIVPKDAPERGWRIVAHSNAYSWHDERAVPPPAAARSAGPGWHPWTVPIQVAGTAGRIAGRAILAARPARSWIIAPLIVAIVLGIIGWNGRRRAATLAATAIVAAASSTVAVAGLAGLRPVLAYACGGIAVVISLALLARFRSPVGQLSVCATLAMAGILVASGTIEVLVLAVPLSSLSTEAARLATATALGASLVAITLAGREVVVSGLFDAPGAAGRTSVSH
jgi:hypothetical protein